MGPELDEDGWVKDPIRLDWKAGTSYHNTFLFKAQDPTQTTGFNAAIYSHKHKV
jgi:hypothetical protein